MHNRRRWLLLTIFMGLASLLVMGFPGSEETNPPLPLMPPGEAAVELAMECALCHFDISLGFMEATHNEEQVACPACHGISKGHREAENNDVKPDVHFRTDRPEERESKIEQLCFTCHADTRVEIRRGDHHEAPRSETGKPALCADCHDPHR